MTINQYEFSQNPLDLTTFDTRKRWQLRPPPQFPAPWAVEWGADEYGLWQTFSVKGIPLKMRYIPPGQFLMGSSKGVLDRYHDELQHTVVITGGFWLAETTVTQELWQVVMKYNPSSFNPKTNALVKEISEHELPVENVNWHECFLFLEKLNNLIPNITFTFPTEAQWEYSCRAGTQSLFNNGDTINRLQANFDDHLLLSSSMDGNGSDRTFPVKSFSPNAWGLYQMHGNLWEWCTDGLRDYPSLKSEPVYDPIGPSSDQSVVVRGGAWISNARRIRSASRNKLSRDYDRADVGLRPCCISYD